MGEKRSVGRPKLADNNLKKKASAMIVLSVLLVIMLMGTFYVMFNSKKLKGESVNAGISIYNINKGKKTNLYNDSNSNRIHFIRTSKKGDSILLESNGHYGLIDVSYCSDYKHIKSYMTKVGVKKLDFVQFSHSDPDHIGMGDCMGNQKSGWIRVLKEYKPDVVYIKNTGNDFYGRLNKYVEKLNNNKDKSYDIEVVDVNKYVRKNKNVTNTTKISFRYCINNNGVDYTKTICNSKNKKFTNIFRKWNIYMYNAPILGVENGNAENAESIVTQVIYDKENIAALYGDMSYAQNGGEDISNVIGEVEILKVPHHGNSEKWSTGTLNSTKRILNNLKAKNHIITNFPDTSLTTNYETIIKENKYSKNIYYTTKPFISLKGKKENVGHVFVYKNLSVKAYVYEIK